MTNVLPSLVVSVLALAAVACSSSPPSDAGNTNTSNIPTPPANVSFMTDVMPLLQTNCSTSGSLCHGATTVSLPTATQPRPFLGAQFGTPDMPTLQTIHDGLVGVKSNEDPTMNYVTAGDGAAGDKQPSQSYLWFKITAQQDTLTASCTNPQFAGCGLAMPYLATPLTPPELSIIEGWIQQGALNN